MNDLQTFLSKNKINSLSSGIEKEFSSMLINLYYNSTNDFGDCLIDNNDLKFAGQVEFIFSLMNHSSEVLIVIVFKSKFYVIFLCLIK